jgi:Arc/MetJ-type ribon-helix-helix transcriptional regulator
MGSDQMPSISARLPSSLIDDIDDLVRYRELTTNESWSRARVIREASRQWLEEQDDRERAVEVASEEQGVEA